MGESGESYAFNTEGEMISESRFTRQLIEMGMLDIGEKSGLNIDIRDPETIPITNSEGEQVYQLTVMAMNATSGYSGLNVEGYNDYRGVPVIGVWKWVEKYGFGMTTEIDHEEAYKTYFLTRKMGYFSIALFIFHNSPHQEPVCFRL